MRQSTRFSLLPLLASLLVAACLGCIRRETASVHLELSIYNGIKDVVRLGDSEGLVAQHARWTLRTTDPSSDSMAEALGFNQIDELEEIGTRVYFRHGRVALIRLQDPFRGTIQGKELQVFAISSPKGNGWEETLLKEFGQPLMRASGGRFGSEALYYSWGDLVYNRMGPNEIAIYHDPDIASYRRRNFGRDIQLFKN